MGIRSEDRSDVVDVEEVVEVLVVSLAVVANFVVT